MKFSQKTKDMNRRRVQKRLKKFYRGMIGCNIYPEFSSKHPINILDQTVIDGYPVFLTQDANGKYVLYKAFGIGKYVQVSSNRMLDNLDIIGNPKCWDAHTKILVSPTGKIGSIELEK